MYQRFEVVLPRISQDDACKRLLIGYIICGVQKESVFFDTVCDNSFVVRDSIIGQSIEELFTYFATDKGILPVMVYPETKEFLKKYGWYEGRNTDIHEIIMKTEEDETPISSSQIAFLSEYGGIKGVSTSHESFEIYDKLEISPLHSGTIRYHKRKTPSTNDMSSYNPINTLAYQNNVDMLCVGTIGNGMIPLWISTDGVLFTDQGTQLGRTIMEGLQTILLS